MSRVRRGWPFIFLGFLLFLVLYRLHLAREDTSSLLEPLTLPIESTILHPGDFVDPAGYPDTYIVPAHDSAVHEPDGEGTLHDLPYVNSTHSRVQT